MEHVSGGGEPNASTSGVTLGGILSIKQTPPYRVHDRTLLDLIRDDQISGKESKNTWKMFRQKFRLKLSGSVCTTAVPVLPSHVHVTVNGNGNGTAQLISPPVNNINTSSVPDTQTVNVQTETPAPEVDRGAGGDGNGNGDGDGNGNGNGDGDGERTPARMSLMTLLEVEGSAYMDAGEDEEEETEEEEEAAAAVAEGDGGGYKYNNCCVCMVRHKGAAFIPCGHTFCRLCSRELFVKRASCPLCNNFILEILDIF